MNRKAFMRTPNIKADHGDNCSIAKEALPFNSNLGLSLREACKVLEYIFP